MKKTLFFTCIFCLLICFASAQTINPDILRKPWKAFWISQGKQPNREYGVYQFRKTIELPEKPTSFIVHVSADNRYKLFVNGNWISHGPARGDLYHWNFETIDIAPFLQAGKNTLAATVWNFGSDRPENQITFRTAFILQGNSDKEQLVNTNDSWKVIKDTAYQVLKPDLIYTYYAAGSGEKIDFNKHSSGWNKADFDDSGWENATQLFNGLPKGVFAWTDGWMLVPRTIPQMELKMERANNRKLDFNFKGTYRTNFEDSDEVEKVSQRKEMAKKELVALYETISKEPAKIRQLHFPVEIPEKSTFKLLLDQSYLTNAYPVLKFSKGKNAKISLGYAEALYVDEGNAKDWKAQNQKGNRNEIAGKRFVGVKDELISNGSDNQLFISLMFRTYRYLQLTIETQNEPLTIDDLYGIATGYPLESKSKFDVQNPDLNKMLEVGWRTARLCATETYNDCPYYEQLQYFGDARIQALVTLFNTDDDRLVRNAISQADYSRMPEGITLSRFPTANPQEIPPFSLWWIGMVHDFWRYRHDEAFIRSKLPGIRQVLSWFKQYQQEDGTLQNVPYWNFTDWADYGKGWNAGVAPVGQDGRSSVLDLQLLWAYQLAAELENNLGVKEIGRDYENQAQQLKTSVKKLYWNENQKLFAETSEKNTFSQHSNTLAILTGILTNADAKVLADKILIDKTLVPATIYFKYYVHQAIAKAGLGDTYLDLLTDWRTQLANGLTTWAEISDHNRSRSDCHAWGSSPNIEFFRIVLGIDSESSGFQRVKVEPHLGNLKNVSGKIPHPNGEISVRIETDKKGKQTAEISIPAGTSGIFIWKGRTLVLKPGETNLFKL
jgi:hypothetical protein